MQRCAGVRVLVALNLIYLVAQVQAHDGDLLLQAEGAGSGEAEVEGRGLGSFAYIRNISSYLKNSPKL